MTISRETVCEELLLDLICYEKFRGRLSSEMEYLFQTHLEVCPSCRRKAREFQLILRDLRVVRNFG
jgi:hypothetical protein